MNNFGFPEQWNFVWKWRYFWCRVLGHKLRDRPDPHRTARCDHCQRCGLELDENGKQIAWLRP